MKKRVEVVGAVIIDNGDILCTQRGESKLPYISKKWEFPGGKVEPGESKEDAVGREINEELCLKIRALNQLLTIEHEYPDFHLTMHVIECELLEPRSRLNLREHLAYKWLQPGSECFENLDWAAADIPAVEALKTK